MLHPIRSLSRLTMQKAEAFYKEVWPKARFDPRLFIETFISPAQDRIISPEPPQLKWLIEAHRDENWWVAGNSGGKTWGEAFKIVWWACYKKKPNRKNGLAGESYEEWVSAPYEVLCTGPESKHANELWETVLKFFKDSPYLRHKLLRVVVSSKLNPHPVIQLKNGANITSISLDDKGKHVEGDDYDLIAINEPASLMSTHLAVIMENTLKQRTWRRGGSIDGFGTAKGKGDFFDYWKRGQLVLDGIPNKYYSPKVFSMQSSSFENKKAELAKVRDFQESAKQMGRTDLIKERIEGAFIDAAEAAFPDSWVFKMIDPDFKFNIYEGLAPSSGRKYVTGVDFGRKNDYSVAITLDVTSKPYQLVHFFRAGGGVVSWEFIFSEVQKISKRYGSDFLIDATSAGGDMQSEYIRELGISYEEFIYTPARKIELINRLQDGLAREEIRTPYIEVLRDELRIYPKDLNDAKIMTDCVMALALAYLGAADYVAVQQPYSY